MSEPENFLTRWSRRKAEAKDEPVEGAAPAPGAEEFSTDEKTEQANPDSIAPVQPESPEPEFDISTLPPIESICASTDVSAFLKAGVPANLVRAALRRAWAADPKIRDFVGLADYDWDFNTPGSMAGFGPLEMTEELRQVVARIIGPAPAADRIGRLDPAPAELRAGQDSNEINAGEHTPTTEQNDKNAGIAEEAPKKKPDRSRHDDEMTRCGQDDAATQHQPETPETLPSIVSRSHGRALPK